MQVEAAWRASPISHTIHTYGVERNNLTIRQHTRRMGREVNAFSKAQTIWNINSRLHLHTTTSLSHIVTCGNAWQAHYPPKGTRGPIRNGNQ